MTAARRWRARAPGKVNLCLFLGPVRDDGRHELVTLIEPLSLYDDLTLEPLADRARDEVFCPGVRGHNLAADALAAWREASGRNGPPVRLTIDKRVPVAAGMGGGSGDAAAALRLAAAAAGRPDDPALTALAARLGSDVPAMLVGGPVIAAGAGEEVTPVPELPEHALVVLPSDERLSTAAVYAEADRLDLPRAAAQLAEQRAAIEGWLSRPTTLPPDLLVNDLEPAARSLCASIDGALADARAAGAATVMVSGSGPTVVGIFTGPGAGAAAADAAAALSGRWPGAIAAAPVDRAFATPEPLP